MAKRQSTEERFWAKVDRSGECWVWTAGRDWRQYGHFSWKALSGKKEQLAHRYSWSLTNGPIPDGLDILHSCDNPPCVNPAHLRAGTHSENMQEMIVKGRRTLPRGDAHHFRRFPETALRGERNGSAKLTEDHVRAIRVLAANDTPRHSIAVTFGLHESTVGLIVCRRTWKHVD